jgi:L-threonine-O-3-phosphate decarboxylase
MAKTSTTVIHGGLDLAELRAAGVDPKDALDFSASLNPLGAPPGIWRAIAKADIAGYPDRRCTVLVEELSRHLGVPGDCILPGNGSSELIHLLAQTYLRPGDAVCLFTPTFGEYEGACEAAGGKTVRIEACESDGFLWRDEEVTAAIRRAQPKLAFLCNPNNPTGVLVSKAFVQRVAKAMPKDSLLVLDEAYMAFAEKAWKSLPLTGAEKVAVMRSMTKDYGLAGVRLGHLVASPQVIERLRPHQPSWSVSSVAQAAGEYALSQGRHVEGARREVRRAKAYLGRELRQIGLRVQPSSANFLLVQAGDASAIRARLLERGMIVRDCTSFGLPAYIRIGIRKSADCRRLVAGLKEVLRRG